MNENPSAGPQAGAAAAGQASSNPPDFEAALAELEAIVNQMESGALPLDQSLAAYEKGVRLAQFCQARLDTAEEQVKVLQGDLLRPLDAGPL